MIVSSNEIAATVSKAVRGCCHPEGIAEEIGFSIRWLCERELPGLALLLSALAAFDSDAVADLTPNEAEVEAFDRGLRIRAIGDGVLSALRVAPSIVELAVAGSARSAGRPSPCVVELETMSHPLLLVPFLAREPSDRISARWSTSEGPVLIESSEAGIRIQADHESSLVAPVGRDVVAGPSESDDRLPVIRTAAGLAAMACRSIGDGCLVDDADWRELGRLAWRTYVPVSDESRLRGAGAGPRESD